MRRGLSVAAAVLVGFAAVLLSLPVWAAEEPPPNKRVEMSDTRGGEFLPPTLEVPAGTTVVWRNEALRAHNVTADDGSFASEPVGNGQRFTHLFETPGTYPYHCTFHGAPGEGMAGTIVVLGELPTSTSSSTSTTGPAGPTTTRRTVPIPPGPMPTFTVPTGMPPPLLPQDTLPPNLPGSVTDPTPLDVGPLQAAPGELEGVVLDEERASDDRPWALGAGAFALLSGTAVATMVTARRTLGEGTPPLPPA